MIGLRVVNSKLALDESNKKRFFVLHSKLIAKKLFFSYFSTNFVDHMLENFQVTEIMTLISKLVDHVNHSAIYS